MFGYNWDQFFDVNSTGTSSLKPPTKMVPVCAGCWRIMHPEKWPVPWRYTEVTDNCSICNHPTESGIKVSVEDIENEGL